MNNPPKKYTKEHGIIRLNPEYKRWKEAFGDDGTGEESNKVTKIQVNLYASRLKNVAGLGKISDPFAVVSLLATTPDADPKVIGKTEVIKNNLSPKWTTSFMVEYSLGQNTRIHVAVYDEVKARNKEKQMGASIFEIGEVLGSRGNVKAKKLKTGGTMFVRAVAAPPEETGRLMLKLQGIKLKNVEGLFGKSDPFVEISAKVNSAGGLTWMPVYRSKQIDNDLNPKWEEMDLNMNKLCQGDRSAPILISVYDWEKNGKHRSMGSIETTVNALMSSVVPEGHGKNVDTTKAYALYKQGKDYGKIVVTGAIIRDAPVIKKKTAPKRALTIPKPLAIPSLAPLSMGNSRTPPHSPLPSIPVVTAVSPVATPVVIGHPSNNNLSYGSVCSSNHSGYGSVCSSNHSGYGMGLAGSITPPRPPRKTRSPMRHHSAPRSPNRPPAKSPRGKSDRPKFVDYLTGGCELQMVVAIDFTGSNGDPRTPGTLHYIHRDGQLNDYEKAITAVGGIVSRYDTDQKFQVLGFGAKFDNRLNNCFRVGPSTELSGIAGILNGYRDVFRHGLTMSGPTVFADVITETAYQAREKQAERARDGKQAYHILLILTDGAVSNMELTKMALIQASDAPLSIIIVGIGNDDFSTMQELDDFLDGEDAAGRDIVQFIEFSKHQDNRESLTRETLDEVPDQLVDYFYDANGIMPLPPLTTSKFSVFESEFSEGDDPEINLEFGGFGDIVITNPEAGTFDDRKYATYADYAIQTPAPMAPVQSVPITTQTQVFQVQVPQNGYPGMQLQVQNPFTHQNVMVIVPPGVSAGQTFAVA